MNEKDRATLEAAARVVGYRIHGWIGSRLFVQDGDDPFPWNPLEDDGDAFRLVIQLKVLGKWTQACADSKPIKGFHSGDPYEACRRAFTESAAALEKSRA